MSMIDKLQILGVRSFDNKKAEIIQFYKPLTLIVGLNGSGKTTIIECLRYATTGELPPNSSTGGAWVHDAKLAGENEVLAQVKLSFNSTDGARMVVNRSIQVMVRKMTRSQKVLDSTLVMLKNGERKTMCSRVAELNDLAPRLLGVSKAILESVIFCHQDDSLWPMSTPAILKKKFDEIFEAQKYTRAVDNIKLIRKQQEVEKKVLEEKERGLRREKDRGIENRAKAKRLDEEIEALREQLEILSDKVAEAHERSTAAFDQAAQVNNIVVVLTGKRNELKTIQRDIDRLKQTMKPMLDTDQDLRDMLEQYEDRLALKQGEKESLTVKWRGLNHEIEQNRQVLGKCQSEQGLLQGQKLRYEEQLARRKQLVRDTAHRHNIRGFDVDITDDDVHAFMQKIGKLEREQQDAFERARKETHEESQEAQQEMSLLSNRMSELTQLKASASNYIQQNDSKISRHQREFDSMDIDEGRKAMLESGLQGLEQKLSLSKQDFANEKYEIHILKAEADYRSLDLEKERLDIEMVEASRRAKESARVDLLHKDLKDRRQGLDTVQGAHKSRINSILECDWTPESLEELYQSAVSDKTTAVKDAELQRDCVIREADQAKFKLSEARKSLQRKQEDHANHEKVLREALQQHDQEPDQFMATMAQVEEDLTIAQSDGSKYEAMLGHWEQAKADLEGENICTTCKRPFDGAPVAKDQPDFRKDLEKKIKKAINAAIRKTEAHAVKAKADALNKLKNLRPRYDAWLVLSKDLPGLRSEVFSLQSQVDMLNSQLEKRDNRISELVEAKREVEAIAKIVQGIVKYRNDILGIEEQLKQATALQHNSQASRGLEQIQDEQKALNERLKAANSELQQLRAGKDRAQSNITSLEFQIRDIQAQLSTAVTQLKEKTQLLSQIEDLKSMNSTQRNIIRAASEELQNLAPRFAQTQAKLDDVRTQGDERVRTLQKGASKLSDSVNQLRIAEQEVTAYLDRGGPQKLARAEREIANVTDEITRLEGELRKLTIQIKKLETEVANQDELKRQIMENLAYREAMEGSRTLGQDISELESHNAEEDQKNFEQEGTRWGNLRTKFSAEHATIVGEVKAKDNQLEELEADYVTNLADAKKNWRESKVRLVVTGAAISDLARYGGALDQAIMKYHSLKMDAINRIIDELWRNTYQGTDVDTIMIKSESETPNKNKSYNYRVVMLKQDAEMDMRGRCSAGQKVLASIIIRLALAECFGVRCGLIALDEPTTNLDRDNIVSLAKSLSEIIQQRRQQSNFQLIVITHDEEFLKEMSCADYTDYYYRIGRDANMCSQIYKQSIQTVMG